MKLLACFLLLPILSLAQSQRGVMLGDLTWQQAEKILTPETIIVIPLGAEAKEHGPHLVCMSIQPQQGRRCAGNHPFPHQDDAMLEAPPRR